MEITQVKTYNNFSIKKPKQTQILPYQKSQHANNPANLSNAHKLLAANNISFHGLFGFDRSSKATPEDKLNAAIQSLDYKSVVLFSDDFENAKTYLTEQLNSIKFPMENIYFVKNTINDGAFAVYKDKQDGKYKIFRLRPLDTVQIYDADPETAKFSDRHLVFRADDPFELKDNKYISFGPYKQEAFIKTNFSKTSLRFIFEKEVDKYTYLNSDNEIKKYNSTRLAALKQKSNKPVSQIKKIKFADIGAQDENIKALEENVIFPILYPDFYKNFRINKGILLYGPPRCGKTMLALALANELGVNFIKIGANDLTHAHVGKTEENWRNLFKTAREAQPTMIFIDEIDSIARSRGGSSDTARHQDDIVNQLLTLMSDLEKTDDKVFVIAATNRADLLDKALINTGRFGLSLEVKAPDLAGTKQIYNIHQKDKPLDDNIDKDLLCQKMFENHFNGSDIAETFYIAHSCAMNRLGIYDKMRNRTVCGEDLKNFRISQCDMEKAIEKLAAQKI